MQINAL